MAIEGVGSMFTYWYDSRTGKISGRDGAQDKFAGYYNGDSDLQGEVSGSLESADDGVLPGASLMERLREHMDHMYIDGRLMNEKPSFSIGAASYTEEEWKKFMEYVDLMSAVDAGEKARVRKDSTSDDDAEEKKVASIAEGIPVQSVEETAVGTVADDGMLLTSETSRCSYPSQKAEEEEIHYIVCYTEDGIICKRAGEKEAVWQMSYSGEDDHGKVMSFLEKFDSDENLRFAAHKNFWQDYLSGEIEEEDFLDFFSRAEDGVPNFFIMTENGMDVDRDSLKYQKYFAQRSIDDPDRELPDFVGTYLKYPSEFFAWQEAHQRRTFSEAEPEDAFLEWYYAEYPAAVRKENPYNNDDWLRLAEAFDRWKEELDE